MTSSGGIITLVGVSLILFYVAIQLFNYFDISVDQYAVYLMFYAFLFISLFILPRTYKLTGS